MTEQDIREQDLTIGRDELERIIERYGQKALQMGTLNEDGSLSIAKDCIPEVAQPTLESEWGNVPQREPLPFFDSSGSFIDRVIETRKQKIVELTRAVQDAPTEVEAKRNWRKLEHLMFGI